MRYRIHYKENVPNKVFEGGFGREKSYDMTIENKEKKIWFWDKRGPCWAVPITSIEKLERYISINETWQKIDLSEYK